MASDDVLQRGVRLMRLERDCERLQLSWEMRLRNRGLIERFLARHSLTWNDVRDYGLRHGLLT